MKNVMKNIFVVTAVLLVNAASASVSFANGENVISCVKAARSSNRVSRHLDKHERLRLCSQAPSPEGPVACASYAIKHTKIDDSNLVALCQFAEDESPAVCFDNLTGLRGYNKDEYEVEGAKACRDDPNGVYILER